jgi:hypothetical protein
MLLFFCSGLCPHSCVAVQKNNLRRLLRTVEALSDLGPEMTAEREFPQTARAMVSALLQAGGAREAVLFTLQRQAGHALLGRFRRVCLDA